MKTQKNTRVSEQGFSLLELLAVVVVILILTAVSLIYLSGTRKLYNTDEQALQLIDLIQEGRQRALTQRETLRVEVDLTSNTARLINEKNNDDGSTTAVATDDILLRQVKLFATANVRLDMRPNNVSTAPPENIPAPTAVFAGSLHPLSAGHNVATFRFMPDGSVRNAGTNPVGLNSVPTGSTLYVWKPKASNNNEADLTKAITIIGSTGSVRMWDFALAPDGTSYWKDSRRSGYGNPSR
jgi:prepilin-type N-terminal cleavage/methylation domain-containing protein